MSTPTANDGDAQSHDRTCPEVGNDQPQHIPWNSTQSRVGEQLNPRTARRLRERFAESDARLGELLGRELSQFWGGD